VPRSNSVMIRPSFSGQQPERMLSDPKPVLYRKVRRRPGPCAGTADSPYHVLGTARQLTVFVRGQLPSATGNIEEDQIFAGPCSMWTSLLARHGLQGQNMLCNERQALVQSFKKLRLWTHGPIGPYQFPNLQTSSGSHAPMTCRGPVVSTNLTELGALVHVWSTCHRSRAVRSGLQRYVVPQVADAILGEQAWGAEP